MICRTEHTTSCFCTADATLRHAFIWLLTRLLVGGACVIQGFVLPVDSSCFACFALICEWDGSSEGIQKHEQHCVVSVLSLLRSLNFNIFLFLVYH